MVTQTNILVDAGGRARVAGFGVTSIPSAAPRVEVDTFFHGAAPELIDPQRFRLTNARATAATDVYAFGVLAFEVSEGLLVFEFSSKMDQVFAGRVPFHDKGNAAGVYSMFEGRRPGRPVHPELTDCVWKMIRRCWNGNPARRHTMVEVVAVLEAEANAHKFRYAVLST